MTGVKQRHGCLTAWLILMIIANSASALIYIFASGKITANLPNAAPWTIPTLIVAAIANIVFSVALFQWKKWGFFGFVVTAVVALIVNVKLGITVVQIIFGLLGVVILYAVLQIGKENKGWPQLE